MPTIYRVNAGTFREIVDQLSEGAKIKAIKTLRRDVDCGLREAKLAIERLVAEHPVIDSGGRDFSVAVKQGARIICGPAIKRIVVDYGTGDLEVDLEDMQLRALMELQEIGLDACRDILTLVDTLTAFSEGKEIGVIEDEKEQEEV